MFFDNGVVKEYENLISTIPLPELLKKIEVIQDNISQLIPKLKYNSVHCMNLCLNKINNHNFHWLYFPQWDIPFSRLFFSSNFSNNNSPKGKSTCSALVTYNPESKFDPLKFERQSIQSLIELGFLKNESEIEKSIPLNIKYGFPLPTIGLLDCLEIIQCFLKENNIYSIGRYGEWKYAGIEHAIEDGKKIANHLIGV